MARRRGTRSTAALTALALALGSASFSSAAPAQDGAGAGSPTATAAKKKKCKSKKGKKLTKKQRKRCKRKIKLIPSTLTVTCPPLPVAAATPVTITGTLSPDSDGGTPLGAVWETAPQAPSDDNVSFFTAAGGGYSFGFTPAAAGTTTVRVDFAGDTLFADRRQASASCSFTVVP